MSRLGRVRFVGGRVTQARSDPRKDDWLEQNDQRVSGARKARARAEKRRREGR